MNNAFFSKIKLLRHLLPILLFIITPARADSVHFDGWTHQKFSLFSSNDYMTNTNEVVVSSNGTVSMIWSATTGKDQSAQKASWTWQVSNSVPPTDLTIKGGDDRNLALYFVFGNAKNASILKQKSLPELLGNKSIKVLMYVFGGAHKHGDFLPTPYLGEQGKTIILRPSGLGRFKESVNLADDFSTAFGSSITTLIGLALSADSDDTKSKIRATVSDLELHRP
jgi:hypothetical protein